MNNVLITCHAVHNACGNIFPWEFPPSDSFSIAKGGDTLCRHVQTVYVHDAVPMTTAASSPRFRKKRLTALSFLNIIMLLWCKFIYCWLRQRRCLSWNRHISRIRCGEKERTASVKEWKPKAAAWFWKDAVWKAERDSPRNYYKMNRKVPLRNFSVLLAFSGQ